MGKEMTTLIAGGCSYADPNYVLYKKYDNGSRNMSKVIVLIILFIVGISSLYLVYQIKLLNDKSILGKLVYYGMIYFTFHTLVLDFIYWSYSYFN